jgi:hypothetical protein
MAGETITTSLTELIYGEWINPFVQSFAGQYRNPSQFLGRFDPQNGSSTVSLPRWNSDQGNPNDDGVAVDTEFNTTEAAEINATELQTLDATFSIAEYGIRRDPSDTAIEDAISAASLLSYIATDSTSNLLAAANDDACALFASFTNASGVSGVDLSISNVDDALYGLADRGVMGSLVGILDNQAVRDFFAALQATGTSLAIYAGSADRQMNTQFSPDQGRNVEGFVLRYKDVDFYRQGMTDTANTGADVVSAIFKRGGAGPGAESDQCALAQGSRRDFRIEVQRDASKRTTEVITTMRWGCGKNFDQSGQKLVTDA